MSAAPRVLTSREVAFAASARRLAVPGGGVVIIAPGGSPARVVEMMACFAKQARWGGRQPDFLVLHDGDCAAFARAIVAQIAVRGDDAQLYEPTAGFDVYARADRDRVAYGGRVAARPDGDETGIRFEW